MHLGPESLPALSATTNAFKGPSQDRFGYDARLIRGRSWPRTKGMSQMTNDKTTAGKATRLIERRWVARPQHEAFAYTADFSNIQHWDPGVVSSTKITNGPVGVGTRYEVELRFGSGTTQMIYEIAVYEPYRRVVLVGSGEKLDATDEIRFASHDNMTVIDYTADLSFRNFFRFLGPLLRPRLEKVGKDALDGLAKALDG